MTFGAGSETLGYFALQSFWGTEVVSVQFSIAQRGSETQKILTGDPRVHGQTSSSRAGLILLWHRAPNTTKMHLEKVFPTTKHPDRNCSLWPTTGVRQSVWSWTQLLCYSQKKKNENFMYLWWKILLLCIWLQNQCLVSVSRVVRNLMWKTENMKYQKWSSEVCLRWSQKSTKQEGSDEWGRGQAGQSFLLQALRHCKNFPE